MTIMDANAFLMSGGQASAKFAAVGAKVRGRVLREPELQQQTDPKTKAKEFWPDGNPKNQVLVHLQTTMRDPTIPDDDGVRVLYVKGQMQIAIRDAVRAAHADGIHTGGELEVTYTGDGVRTDGNRALDPPKLYSAWYQAPPTAANGALMGANGTTAGTPPPTPTIASPQPAPSYAQSVTPNTANTTATGNGAVPEPPRGVDPAVWAAMEPVQRTAVLTAMGAIAPY